MKEKQMDNTLAGYILAGGKNTRMGGRKKLFLKYRGKQFYLWLKNGLKAAGALYVSVEEYAPYEGLDAVLVKDIYKGTGPIGGICTGLKLCQEDALLVVPCDMVPVPDRLLKDLMEIYRRTGRPVCPSAGDRLLPLPAVYSKEMLPAAEELIAEGNCRLCGWWERSLAGCEILPLEHTTVNNVNTKEDYKRLEGQ